MTTEQKMIKNNVGLLNFAQTLGNVSQVSFAKMSSNYKMPRLDLV